MDKKKLLDFLHMWIYDSPYYFAFANTGLSVYEELHECCCNKDASLTKEWYDYFEDDPYYMSDYLSNEEIIDVIERAMVGNERLAGHFARRFYDTGDDDYIDPYLCLISSYELATGLDIYNPEIFHECF